MYAKRRLPEKYVKEERNRETSAKLYGNEAAYCIDKCANNIISEKSKTDGNENTIY